MTVTAPPRPPQPSDPVGRDDPEALEALIEEARQRTRRRRRRYAAATAVLALIGVSLSIVFTRSGPPQDAAAGLPAPAAAPDPGEAASIVAQQGEYHVGYVFVYADGRVLVQPYHFGVPGLPTGTNPPMGAVLERRLTPAGLELVRSGEVEARAFLTRSTAAPSLINRPAPTDGRPPLASLPAGEFWADAEFKPYAPAEYAVAFLPPARDGIDGGAFELPPPGEPFGDEWRALPEAVQPMLRGRERTQDLTPPVIEELCRPLEKINPHPDPLDIRFFALSSAEASALRDTLIGEGWVVENRWGNLWDMRPAEPCT